MPRATLLALSILVAAAPARAADPVLVPPIDCDLATACFIPRYVDVDPGPGQADYQCGPLTGDGHKGTDFGIPAGVGAVPGTKVRPAAPGTVRAIRDGVPDTGIGPQTDGEECGNGVVVSHGDGWETQYCHLKQGSVAVQRGQTVRLSTVLGEVGLSGLTTFPHVHLSVRKSGKVVDPFAPDADAQCGQGEGHGMWNVAPPYRPGGLIAVGFADRVPEFDTIKAGEAAQGTLPATAPALVVWAYGFGGRAGDSLALTIDGPAGRILASEVEIEKPQALYYRALGRTAKSSGWPQGLYHGRVTLKRAGVSLETRDVDLTVRP